MCYEEKLYGTVKWWNEKLGYGYITVAPNTNEAKDYFVHWKNIISNHKFKKLKEGWAVSFNPDHNEKGDLAINVTVIPNNN